MPTIGAFRCRPPIDPKKGALNRLSQNTLGALTGLGVCTQNSHFQAILRQPVKRKIRPSDATNR